MPIPYTPNPLEQNGPKSNDPARGGFSITPSDTEVFRLTRGVYVGITGDLKVTLQDGSVLTFSNLTAGCIHPIACTKVWAASTAALINGVY